MAYKHRGQRPRSASDLVAISADAKLVAARVIVAQGGVQCLGGRRAHGARGQVDVLGHVRTGVTELVGDETRRKGGRSPRGRCHPGALPLDGFFGTS